MVLLFVPLVLVFFCSRRRLQKTFDAKTQRHKEIESICKLLWKALLIPSPPPPPGCFFFSHPYASWPLRAFALILTESFRLKSVRHCPTWYFGVDASVFYPATSSAKVKKAFDLPDQKALS